MVRIPNLVSKRDPFAYWGLPLYLYLVGAYSRFLTVGKCLDFPLMVQIQTQSFCNASCSICPYRIVSQKLDQGAMERDLFLKIADEAASEPLLSRVVFDLQNEPLLDKEIFHFVNYFKSLKADKWCALVTNGELLDRFSLTDIVESGLDELVVSLNAHSEEMYQSINNGLDYERVMKNIGSLLSNSYTRQKLVLSFILTEQNDQEVYQAIQYWHRKGVKTRVIGLVNRAGTLDDYERLRPKAGYHGNHSLLRLWRRLMFRLRGMVGCPFPFYHMTILFNGDAIICCHDWDRATVVGNVRTSSLREIWNSEKMNEIRRLILRKRYEKIDSCKGCSLVGR